MAIDLSFTNFFSHFYILHPYSVELSADNQKTAFYASLALGVCTAGTVHVGCWLTEKSIELWNHVISPILKKISDAIHSIFQRHVPKEGEFTLQMKVHLEWLFGKSILEGSLPVSNISFLDNVQPSDFTAPISFAIYEKNPLIALKVEVADPESYFQTHYAEAIKQIAEVEKTEQSIFEKLKNEQLGEIREKEFAILIQQKEQNRVWTNLGDNKTTEPTIFTGRSYSYRLDEKRTAGEERLATFLQALVTTGQATDRCGNQWRLKATHTQ